jgi:hypothetical protein
LPLRQTLCTPRVSRNLVEWKPPLLKEVFESLSGDITGLRDLNLGAEWTSTGNRQQKHSNGYVTTVHAVTRMLKHPYLAGNTMRSSENAAVRFISFEKSASAVTDAS